MSLVVEDGSGVTGANTFASIATLATYAAARGITLPSTDAAKEQLLIKAVDVLEALEATYTGTRFDSEQELSWPRTDVYREDGSILLSNGQIIQTDEIPKQLVQAQCQLACDIQNQDYFQVSDGRLVVEETVGPLVTKYADSQGGGSDGSRFVFQKFEALISILQISQGFSLTTVRI